MATMLIAMMSIESSTGFQFVASTRGSCIKKKGSAVIKMKMEACRKIGGRYSKNPGLVDCNLEWCDVPYAGAISRSMVYTICKADEQNLKTYIHTPIQDFRPYGVFEMKQGDCKAMNGWMKGNSGPFASIDCHLKLCPFSGNSRYDLKGMILSPANQCGRLVSGSTLLTSRDCMSMGGNMSRMRVVGNSKAKCILDFCEIF